MRASSRRQCLYGLVQKLAAEFIGTFALVFAGVGAVCADQYLRSQSQAGFGLLGIAIAYGSATAIMVTAFAHISGGHLNPAVTIGFWVTKRLGTIQSVLYCVAQLLGAVAAAYLLTAIIPDQAWRPIGLSTPDLGPDFTRWHAMVLEGIMAFILVAVYFATVLDDRGAFNKVAGFAVGLAVAADVLVAAPFLGASAVNPARTLATTLASRHNWHGHGVFWVGPLFGGVIAGVIYDRLFLKDQPPA
jgi:MIP family channel proteins